MENKKVAVYLRVSTEGEKNGREQTTESQRIDIESYLNIKGISKIEKVAKVSRFGEILDMIRMQAQ